MDFFSQLSDDQVALIGCGVALAVCSGLFAISYHFGQSQKASGESEATTLKFPKREQVTVSEERKAA